MTSSAPHDGEPGAPLPVAGPDSGIGLTEAGRFPVLDAGQLDVLLSYGTEQAVEAGEVLFAEGDKAVDLIVVLEGEVQIVVNAGQPTENVIATYGPGQFVGEIALLTGQRTPVAAVAGTKGRVLRVSAAQVRVIMAQEPGLSELMLRTFLIRHANLTTMGAGLTLIGSRFDADTRRVLEVLSRNRLPSRWLDLEEAPDAEALLRQLDVPIGALPIVILPGRLLLLNPSDRALLDALGLRDAPEAGQANTCDLLVVGGGPGGLSAAVYGASEGLATVLAEDTAFGGQAGTSSRIETYLGFPAGLSGEELAARAMLQAEKFGARMKLGVRAVSLSSDAGFHRVAFDDGEVITARSLINRHRGKLQPPAGGAAGSVRGGRRVLPGDPGRSPIVRRRPGGRRRGRELRRSSGPLPEPDKSGGVYSDSRRVTGELHVALSD